MGSATVLEITIIIFSATTVCLSSYAWSSPRLLSSQSACMHLYCLIPANDESTAGADASKLHDMTLATDY